MTIVDEELNKLSSAIWEWTKDGKSLDDAPDDIKEKAQQYKKLYDKAKKNELKLMGIIA